MIEEVFDLPDLLGCKTDTSVIDHLLRLKGSIMRSQTFELIATISAYRSGKRYLMLKKDILVVLIASLCETDAEKAASMKAVLSSEVMEHRWLLAGLFRLS